MSKRPSVLDPLRVRIRRLQLVVGAGLLSVIIGALFSPVISLRLSEWVSSRGVFALVLFTAIGQVWVYAILPVVLYGFARIIELTPWRSAIGAAVTGLLFVLALGFVTAGVESITKEHPARLVTIVLTVALGVLISRSAILAARAAAARAQDEAKKTADARKDEYAEFIREAERVASRHDEEAKPPESAEPPAPKPEQS